MVEIKKLFAAAVFALLGVASADAQQRDIVVGLESNKKYMELVDEERLLVARADSLAGAMTEIRRTFRTDTGNRDANSAALLRMEEESFDIRTRMAHLAGRIGDIEQEWILESLHSGFADRDSGLSGAPGFSEPSGYTADFWSRNLSAAEFEELTAARESEAPTARSVTAYRANHEAMRRLADEYTGTQADTIGGISARFDSLARLNAGLEGEIDRRWSAIFDSKNYIYDLLGEKLGLESSAGGYDLLREREAELRGKFASDVVARYAVQKMFLVGREERLAGEIGDSAARDSLTMVTKTLPRDHRALVDSLGWLAPTRLPDVPTSSPDGSTRPPYVLVPLPGKGAAK